MAKHSLTRRPERVKLATAFAKLARRLHRLHHQTGDPSLNRVIALVNGISLQAGDRVTLTGAGSVVRGLHLGSRGTVTGRYRPQDGDTMVVVRWDRRQRIDGLDVRGEWAVDPGDIRFAAAPVRLQRAAA